MCRMPVTFGGGMTTEYGVPLPGSSWKQPLFSQNGYHLASAALESYLFSIILLVAFH